MKTKILILVSILMLLGIMIFLLGVITTVKATAQVEILFHTSYACKRV
jgi:hypothetical protein